MSDTREATALPATAPFVDRIIRIFRARPDDDTSAAVLRDYATAALSTERAAREKAERERENLQAALTARAKTMLRLRDALTEVHDHIEDEGDRVYFGSTNDADQLRKVWHELDAWNWDSIIADGKLEDVYEASRKAHARAEAAEADVARLREALTSVRGHYIHILGYDEKSIAVEHIDKALAGTAAQGAASGGADDEHG